MIVTSKTSVNQPLLSGYDFIDLGCSNGGSLKFGMEMFGGRGLGIDLDPRKVERAREAGYEAVVLDATTLEPATMGKVRFSLMSHFLEHLPGIRAAERCISAATRVSHEFVLIQQPYFDADGYLLEQGMKLYWSNWRGHTLHMSGLQLHNCLNPLLQAGQVSRFVIARRFPILDSDATEVHALASPIDQLSWNSLHPCKPKVKFIQPVARELCAIALTKGETFNKEIVRYLAKADIIYDSMGAE